MATEEEEQAKKDIVAALRELRAILTRRPKQEYPSGLDRHPEVKKVLVKIERALSPHVKALVPPGSCFRDFLPCDVLPLRQLPADWETLKWLDHYIEDFGGWQKTPTQPTIGMTPEEKTILETLADERPMTVTVEGLAGTTHLSENTVKKYLKILEGKTFCCEPRPKKGRTITEAGLAAIGRGS